MNNLIDRAKFNISQLRGSEDGQLPDDLYVTNMLKRSGKTVSDMDRQMIMKMLSEGMPKEMVIQNILQESGRTISNIDREMVNNNEAKKGGPLGLGIIDAIRGGVGSAFTDPMSAQNYAINAMKSRMKQDEPTIREMFEKEFKQARMEGKEIFEFMGKMYNTKTAEEVQGMSKGGEFPDLTGDGQVTQADILKGRGVELAGGGVVGGISPEDNQMIQRAFSTQSGFDVGQTAQMLKNILVKKYPNIPEPQINAILSKGIEDYSKKPPLQGMAEGGEAIGDELAGMAMSEEEAMAEVGNAEKEMAMIQQLVTVVQQLLAEGISEDDLVAFLKEQGLDDEDIDSLMQMVLQSQSEQGPTEEPIGQELQGMM